MEKNIMNKMLCDDHHAYVSKKKEENINLVGKMRGLRKKTFLLDERAVASHIFFSVHSPPSHV